MAYSLDELKQLWIDAGGSPLKADEAAKVAMAVSGGDPNFQRVDDDGRIATGLWGISSEYGRQASTDPMTNARGAVAVSKNGDDWDPFFLWKWVGNILAGGAKTTTDAASAFANILSPDLLPKFLGYSALIFTGAAMMIVGVVFLFMGSRGFRKVAGYAADVIGSGLGFGLGAGVVDVFTRKRPIEPTPPAVGRAPVDTEPPTQILPPVDEPPTTVIGAPVPTGPRGPRGFTGGGFVSQPKRRGKRKMLPDSTPIPRVPRPSSGGPTHGPYRPSRWPSINPPTRVGPSHLGGEGKGSARKAGK